MSSSDASSLDQLPLALALQIDAVARRAERARRAGKPALIESYLAEVPTEGRAALFEELLTMEVDAARDAGTPLDPSAWITRFPDDAEVIRRVFTASHEPDDDPFRPATKDPDPQPRLPRIRGYSILRELGRGAMGVVYLARHDRLQRLVALKIVAPGVDLSHAFTVIRAEAETIARLRHPNIVQVYEVGKDHGVPYLTIEYVEGESLRDRLLRERFSERQAAELVEQLARAMHHAHAVGVVHRDLKPANILLPNAPDVSASGSSLAAIVGPKITDFGLAKVLDELHEQTISGSLLGTPKYMSPEQAEGRSREIGPPTDVYALGAILFELLTGRAPFEAESSLKLLQKITEQEASFSPTEARTISVDLQAICLKCLEKSPVRRYASALELADDLRRHLDDFPVIARRPTRLTLARKFARRNRTLVTALVTVAAALVSGSVGTAFFAVRESHARLASDRAAEQERDARTRMQTLLRQERENIYWANIRLAREAWEGGRLDRMRELLAQLIPSNLTDEDLRGFEWHYLWRLTASRSVALDAQPNEGRLAYSPDGHTLATPRGRGAIRLWDATTGQPLRDLTGHADYVMDLAFDPTGARLASVSRDGTVRVWDLQTGECAHTLKAHAHPVRSVAFSPDGRRLATADEREKLIAWDTADWHEAWSFTQPELYAMDLDFSPDGQRVAVGSGGGGVLILDAFTGKAIDRFRADHGLWLTGVAFDPTGDRVITCGGDQAARVWDLRTHTPLLELRGHADWLTGVAYGRGGSTIVTSSRDGTLRIWDAATGRARTTLKGHSNWAMSVALSADQTQIASGSLDGAVRLWTPDADWEVRDVSLPPHDATSLAVTDAPRRLVVGSRDGPASVIDPLTGETLHAIQAHDLFVSAVAIQPDGRAFATASHDGTIKLWDMQTAGELKRFVGHRAEINAIAFDPRESRLASACRDGTIRMWDRATGDLLVEKKVADSPVHSIAFSPDGTLLATAGPEETSLWNTATWRKVGTFAGHTRSVLFVAFSPDGKRLATSSSDQTVRVWDVASRAQLRVLQGHTGDVTGLAFSRDGRRLVSCAQDGKVKIWDTNAGGELMSLPPHADWANAVAFNPANTFIVTGGNDKRLRLVELTRPRPLAKPTTTPTTHPTTTPAPHD